MEATQEMQHLRKQVTIIDQLLRLQQPQQTLNSLNFRRMQLMAKLHRVLPIVLGTASFEGNAHAVAAWLDEGGGVDARCAEFDDMTLLQGAAAGGQEAIVRMLLQRDAGGR